MHPVGVLWAHAKAEYIIVIIALTQTSIMFSRKIVNLCRNTNCWWQSDSKLKIFKLHVCLPSSDSAQMESLIQSKDQEMSELKREKVQQHPLDFVYSAQKTTCKKVEKMPDHDMLEAFILYTHLIIYIVSISSVLLAFYCHYLCLAWHDARLRAAKG